MTAGRPARAAVHRIACAIVAAEVRRIRETDLPAAGAAWAEDEPIGEEGLGLDSLERLGALGALGETFDIDAAHLDNDSPRVVGDWIDWIMRGGADGARGLTVHTSGSTGVPKPCRHAFADLLGEAAVFAGRLADRRRVVALVPAHHLYGIVWTALLPAALGIPVVAGVVGASPDLVAGDLVVAVPEQWRAIARLARRIPAGVVGVTSAGHFDDGIAGPLFDKGLERLIDVYGSSETSAIATREVPGDAYTLLPRWRLAAAGGGDWRLVDGNDREIDLPDHVERLGERSLRPAGRRDGAVQVGGRNVWPARVAGMLRAVDGVAEAAVRLHGNGRLKAFIVPAPDQDEAGLRDRLQQAILRRLEPPEQPKSLRFGPALPRNAMGKLEDWT